MCIIEMVNNLKIKIISTLKLITSIFFFKKPSLWVTKGGGVMSGWERSEEKLNSSRHAFLNFFLQ